MRKLIFLILLAVLGSCKKEDYRIKYTGNFLFTNNIKTFITDSTYNDTISIFHGTISLASESDKISIHNDLDITFETIMDKNGVLPNPYPGALGYCFSGRFVGTDSLFFGSSCGGHVGAVLTENSGRRD